MNVIVVTGASRGIGRGLARRLAGPNTSLALGARDVPALEELAGELSPHCRECMVHALDVSNEASVRNFFAAAVERFAHIDVVVNNAGIGLYGLARDVDLSKARRVFDVNLFGLMCCCREAIPHMPAGGKIVNIASDVAFRGFPTSSVYCASKAAVKSFSESLRVELKNLGIGVLTFFPGYTKTDFHRAANEFSDLEKVAPAKASLELNRLASYIARRIDGSRLEYIPYREGWGLKFLNTFCPSLIDRILFRKYNGKYI